jgi:hypothetical protein
MELTNLIHTLIQILPANGRADRTVKNGTALNISNFVQSSWVARRSLWITTLSDYSAHIRCRIDQPRISHSRQSLRPFVQFARSGG